VGEMSFGKMAVGELTWYQLNSQGYIILIMIAIRPNCSVGMPTFGSGLVDII